MENGILKSELGGHWYLDDPQHLAHEINTYLNAVHPEPVEKLIALILPHAGYRYSGMVAAHGIKLLEGRNIKRVIVMGPSHRVAMLESVSIPDASHIETPLGLVPLDREAISNLWKHEGFESHARAHQGEHSVQIELPFLQQVLDDFTLIPIVCGQLTANSAAKIGKQLLPLLNEETLFVISTDFTHYGRSFDYVPFEDKIKHRIHELDMGAFDLIRERNQEGFIDYVETTGATICGIGPLSILLSILSDGASVDLLKYENSGDLTDDWSHCVSYISAAVSGHWKKSDKPSGATDSKGDLTDADKAYLLAVARHRIAAKFSKRAAPPRGHISMAMQEEMGAFVTLHKHGQLRGCIGEIFPRRSLFDAVEEQAVNAAFHDPRFPTLREDELLDIDIEISALTPPRKIDSYEEIEIGRHGIVLSQQMQSAVFLPQVATEQGWGRETALSYLAEKAGLMSDAWKTDCEFHVFEAIVFGE